MRGVEESPKNFKTGNLLKCFPLLELRNFPGRC